MSEHQEFYSKGLRFECQGSGRCCVSRGGYGYVYLTKEDRRQLARQLGMSLGGFTRKHCEKHNDVWKLKDGPTRECMFLSGSKCSVYKARPTQCRTWPFWPEVLNAKAWTREVAAFCPGVGKGKLWSVAEIEQQLIRQKLSEGEYGT